MNGQGGAAKADAPTAGQAEAGEAEDDSDDDADEGNAAPEGGANGGALKLPRYPRSRNTEPR